MSDKMTTRYIEDKFSNLPSMEAIIQWVFNTIKSAEKAAFKRGQESMRERAAKVVEDAHQGECPESMHIRVLPLSDGESKSRQEHKS